MRLEYVYLGCLSVSCATAALLFLDLTVKGILKKISARRSRRRMLASLPEILQRDLKAGGYLDSRVKKAGIRPGPFLALSAALALSGACVGLVVMKDLGATLTLAAGMVFVSLLALDWILEKRERKVIDQLPVAIQLFAVEYSVTKSIGEAMAQSAKGVGEPLKGYMEKCASDLRSSKSPKEVLEDFAGNIGSAYGKLWAQMLLSASEDMTVVKVMPRLIERLSKQRLLQQKNITELSSTRRTAGIVNVLVIPCFILVQILFPQSSGLFNEPLGRVVIALFLLSLCIGIALDRLLQKVDF